jgi:hypothetical protein
MLTARHIGRNATLVYPEDLLSLEQARDREGRECYFRKGATYYGSVHKARQNKLEKKGVPSSGSLLS